MNDSMFDELVRDYRATQLFAEPTEALLMGKAEYAGEHERYTDEFDDSLVAKLRELRERLVQVQAQDDLTRDQALTTTVIDHGSYQLLAGHTGRQTEYDVNHVVGFQNFLPAIISSVPTHLEGVLDLLPSKYEAIAASVDDRVARLREGVESGRTPPAREVAATASQIEEWLSSPLNDDPLLHLPKPDERSEPEWSDWIDERIAPLVGEQIRPALFRYQETLQSEVLPVARPDEQVGLHWLPDGGEIYQKAIQKYTTLNADAEEIHQIGLDAIADIRSEMEKLGNATLGTSSAEDVVERLREDTSLRYQSVESIVQDSEAAITRAREIAPAWFGLIPASECVVKSSPTGPDGWYMPPAPDGSRPGTFYVNASRPQSFGLELEAVAYHETIPGHHLQVGVAQETPGLSSVRRNAEITAFAEGWGLYAEHLANEMDLYSTPLTKLGRLIVASLRAARLVVDTGLHGMGWSRTKALSYLISTTPMAIDALEGQLDRYIGQPGQGLAYHMGLREILEIRADAQSMLGSAFRISGFHDAILSAGSLPLPAVRGVVDDWAQAEISRA